MKTKTFRTILLLEILAFIALLIVLILAAYNTYLNRARQTFQAGISAFQDAEYLTAYQHFNEVTTIFRYTNLPEIPAARSRMDECSLLLYAQFSQQQQDLDSAIHALEVYLDKYPASPIVTNTQDWLARLYFQKAEQLKTFSNYPSALQIYLNLQSRFPSSIIDNVIEANIAGLFIAWGDDLQANGDLALSIEKYTIVLDAYPSTGSLEPAISGITRAISEWHQSLLNSGEYEQVLRENQTLLAKYQMQTFATPLLEQAAGEIPILYDKWGDSQTARGDYAEAVMTFYTLIQQYPDHPAAQNARKKIAICYSAWGSQLRQSADFANALAILGKANQECQLLSCDEEFTHNIQEEMAMTYLDWGTNLKTGGDSLQAEQNFRIVLAGYSRTSSAPPAQESLTRLWLEQSQKWIDEGNRYAAWQTLIQIADLEYLTGISLSSDLKNQLLTVQDALRRELLADTSLDGVDLMMDGLQRICAGMPVSYLGFPFGSHSPLGIVCGPIFTLPDDLQASAPDQLRYAVRLTETLQTVQICRYDNDINVTRLQRIWKIEVISFVTGTVVEKLTFLGDPPPACPTGQVNPGQNLTLTGDPPKEAEIFHWLRSVFK